MRLPNWKKWLSYIWEIQIESIASEINPDLHISLSKGRYQLYTEHAIYSFGDLYDNFGRTFRQLNLSELPGNQVLILGFGLGSIPILLEKYTNRDWKITGIEKDENVLYLANKYGISEIKSPLEIILADAEAFVSQSQQKFDLICMDIYIDDKVPEHFEKIGFLEKLKAILTPEGLLIFNKLTRTRVDLEQSKVFYRDSFQTVFPEATYLDVKGNWSLLNTEKYC